MIASPQLDLSAAASFTGTTASAVTTTLISAITNGNGVIVHYAMCGLNSTVGSACEGRIVTSGGIVLCNGRIDAGAVLTSQAAMPTPVFVPPGQAINHQNVVSPGVQVFAITYTIL
jgi:hypothetical protein